LTNVWPRRPSRHRETHLSTASARLLLLGIRGLSCSRTGFRRVHLAMAASLPRLSLPPTAAVPAVTSSRYRPNLAPVPNRRRLGLRLHRSSVVSAAAASSPSVPSSSPEPGSGIGDALGGVAIFSAATGEPVLIRDLWDQNEVEMLTLFLRLA
jgi:hypothetical protein